MPAADDPAEQIGKGDEENTEQDPGEQQQDRCRGVPGDCKDRRERNDAAAAEGDRFGKAAGRRRLIEKGGCHGTGSSVSGPSTLPLLLNREA
jgi:hypothetical protein